MVSDLPENTRIVRDETGQEAWDSVTTEYTPYGETLRETVVNRDGSIIRSELATPDSAVDWTRYHVVSLADGTVTIFKNYGAEQTIHDADGRCLAKTMWTAHGPEAVPFGDDEVSGGAKPLSKSTMQAAVTLYNWLARRDRADDKVTVFAFSMDSFQPETNGDPLASGAKPAEK